ncbi:MAG: PAS domain S-box protein [Methanoregula sp.]|nr:PAS domain S-box protein [Methanoregula sp.]
MMAAGKKKPEEKNARPPGSERSMRDAAEKQRARVPKNYPGVKGPTTERLVHELQNHLNEIETITEDILKSSESRYRRFFEAVRDGILILDAESGTILDVNPFLIELLGFTHEQFLGKKLWEIGVFKDIAASKDNFKELQEKKYIRFENLPLETADGRQIYSEFVSFVYDVEDKKVMQCNIRDITERKKGEEVLKSSESRYRRFFEAVRDGILIIDAETGTILDVNPFLIELLGFTHEQFLGKKIWEIGVFKDIAASKDNFKELQEKKYIHFENLPLETADGKRIYAEFVSFVYDVEDKTVMQCNIRDITERKRAEVALKESETYLKTIFNSAQTGLLIIDPVTHSIYDVNPAALELLGRTKNELVGTTCHQFICPAERGKCPITDLGQKIDNSERILLIADGERIPILKTVVPIIIQDHSYLLESFVDITDRKLMEAEIRSLNAVLEQRVIERTSQLNASLEDKIVLLREVHHRVKNNLQIIISLFNLQSRYIEDENTRQVFRESQNRVRAMSLVHEKLYQSTDITKIDLENYIRYLGNSLVQFYGMTGKGIILNTRIQDINVDINTAIPVGLIINELISNSLKHAFPDGKKGEISLTIQRENTILTILFADTGVGIPADLDWCNAESMGLRLVIMLVEQLDGTIELDRSSGTMFTIVVKEKE